MSRLRSAIVAAAWNTAALAQVRATPQESLIRTNYAQREVSLAGGIATAVGVTAGAASVGGRAAVAGVIATAAAGGLGTPDDLTEKPEDRATKGLRGHVKAMASGQFTTGGIKLLGITAAGLVAGAIASSHRHAGSPRPGSGEAVSGVVKALDVVSSGALVAGSANLLNLFDLRPGRALKAATLMAIPLAFVNGPGGAVATSVIGASAAAAPSDLGESTMLGDTGANALGAAIGVSLALVPSRAVRAGALAAIVAGTLVSERVSFSRIIASQPALTWLDYLGRIRAQAATSS